MPSAPGRLALGVVTHYAFSIATATLYAALAGRHPAIRRGFGTLYGLAVWALADEGLVPALGLSRGPGQISPGLHAYSMTGHAIYGASLEAVMRLATHDVEAENAKAPMDGCSTHGPSGVERERHHWAAVAGPHHAPAAGGRS